MWGRGRSGGGGGRGRGGGARGSGLQICKEFLKTGRCERGDITGAGKCRFEHVVSERGGAQRHEVFSTRECFDFVNKGACKWGDTCKYRHHSGDKPVSDSHSAFLAARAWAFSKEQKEQQRASKKRKAVDDSALSLSAAPSDMARPALPSCLVVKTAGPAGRPPPADAAAAHDGRKGSDEGAVPTGPAAAVAPTTGLLGLGAYGSSDSEGEGEGEGGVEVEAVEAGG
jgi:hypothetical protein